MRFVLPHYRQLRPTWMIRAGLFLYDHLGGHSQLKKSHSLRFHPHNSPLHSAFTKGFEYTDCWVDDARLVIINALSAAQRGAHIHTYTRCAYAKRVDNLWQAELVDAQGNRLQANAKALINATGPWAQSFVEKNLHTKSVKRVRLIKGSHIIMPRAYEGNHAFILQNEDKRVIFVIPYLDEFSIIGTTDKEYQGDPARVHIDNEEIQYLLAVYNKYFKRTFTAQDVIANYSGVRPLCDDESMDPSAITRDYTLTVEDHGHQAPLLNIYGGKLTTYRKLAEAALLKLRPYFPYMGTTWTKSIPLPGSEVPLTQVEKQLQQFTWLPEALQKRWLKTYGDRSLQILQGCNTKNDLGHDFGGGLTEKEIDFLVATEWAKTSKDILWRRTKLGLTTSSAVAEEIEKYLTAKGINDQQSAEIACYEQ